MCVNDGIELGRRRAGGARSPCPQQAPPKKCASFSRVLGSGCQCGPINCRVEPPAPRLGTRSIMEYLRHCYLRHAPAAIHSRPVRDQAKAATGSLRDRDACPRTTAGHRCRETFTNGTKVVSNRCATTAVSIATQEHCDGLSHDERGR